METGNTRTVAIDSTAPAILIVPDNIDPEEIEALDHNRYIVIHASNARKVAIELIGAAEGVRNNA